MHTAKGRLDDHDLLNRSSAVMAQPTPFLARAMDLRDHFVTTC